MCSPFEESERGCRTDDVARKEPAAEAACLRAATPPEPEPDQEPGKLRGLFRRRGRPHRVTPSHSAGTSLRGLRRRPINAPDSSTTSTRGSAYGTTTSAHSPTTPGP
ncbi:hypothetical protein E5082_32085 [Streptomyces griseoluteus]|uniref:Uncharacterized protein n=1 Tax=Streptomyces griseoluteus TaxID=29306 RepID=A0A4Z1CWV5_STRGP|nr:hypothetical protein E5082_32085 [Streptomyces griseoluteus]